MKKKKIIILVCILILLSGLCTIFAHTFVFNVLGGRIHIPEGNIGDNLLMEDGNKFKVLRRLQVKGKDNSSEGYAVFKVRFKFKSLKFRTNKRLSMIPAPFLMGMKGFREKYWTFNEESEYFQGIYQWESKETAEKYPGSFIYKLMTKRSLPGTLSYEIIPDTDLTEYIRKLSLRK